MIRVVKEPREFLYKNIQDSNGNVGTIIDLQMNGDALEAVILWKDMPKEKYVSGVKFFDYTDRLITFHKIMKFLDKGYIVSKILVDKTSESDYTKKESWQLSCKE